METNMTDFEQPIVRDKTINELLEESQVNTDKKLDKLPAVFSVIDQGKEIDIFTEGNISVIKGKAKARKSFAISMIVGSFLSDTFKFNKFKSQSKKWAILFDTEQSKFYVQMSMFRIMNISDESEYKSRFMGFCLRPYSPEKRLEMIEWFIYNVKDLGLVVIDGIRDLVKDINSADEATMISTRLLRWTEETGCHILTVIHENKGDGSARGHLGAEITNKAETILKVEKQGTHSVLSSEMTRGLDFEDIYFSVWDNVPYVDNNYEQQEESRF
jgi:hypothetical protein